MNTTLKRTTLIACIFFFYAAMFVVGNSFTTPNEAIAEETFQTEVSDVMHDAPLATEATESISTSEEATSEIPTEEPSEAEEAESEDFDYEYEYNYEYEYTYTPSPSGNYIAEGEWVAGEDFQNAGVYHDDGWSYTYYSELILPGGGLEIPGRHTDEEGYVCDADGNVCLASDDLAKGTVVEIPFGSGTGVVYDSGSGYGNLDVYTSWPS